MMLLMMMYAVWGRRRGPGNDAAWQHTQREWERERGGKKGRVSGAGGIILPHIFCICRRHVASINHFIIIAAIRCRSHRSWSSYRAALSSTMARLIINILLPIIILIIITWCVCVCVSSAGRHCETLLSGIAFHPPKGSERVGERKWERRATRSQRLICCCQVWQCNTENGHFKRYLTLPSAVENYRVVALH